MKNAERGREGGRLASDQDPRNYTVVTSRVFLLSHVSHTRCQGSHQPRNTNGSKQKKVPRMPAVYSQRRWGDSESTENLNSNCQTPAKHYRKTSPPCSVDTTWGARTSIPSTASLSGLWQEAQVGSQGFHHWQQAPPALPAGWRLQRPWGEAWTPDHNQQ